LGPAPAGGRKPFWRSRGFWVYFIAALVLNYLITFAFMNGPTRVTMPYTTFIQQVNAGNVKSITAQGNSIQGNFTKSVTYGSASGTLFQTERPVFASDNLEFAFKAGASRASALGIRATAQISVLGLPGDNGGRDVGGRWWKKVTRGCNGRSGSGTVSRRSISTRSTSGSRRS